MIPKVIKTEAEYRAQLARVENLIDLDPDPGSARAEELELLSLLVKQYESEHFPAPAPGPVAAIRFRMEQANLAPRDLIPLIGSRSRVSEVLSGKRSLTLSMIRSLYTELGIPANALLQSSANPERQRIDIEKFPIREMVKRSWVDSKAVQRNLSETISLFLKPLHRDLAPTILCRKTRSVRSARNMDPYSVIAWSARIGSLASKHPPAGTYRSGTVTFAFMRQVAQLSPSAKGPLLAQEFLSVNGISLVIEEHLPKTYLDGAAILLESGRPVIGMTLRFDRIDNFWFTLMHELAHISLHFGKEGAQFFDDLEASSSDYRELEADAMATEVLVPENIWKSSAASRSALPSAARMLAEQLRIHPAIVAGRMRRQFRAYRLLNNVIGLGTVRRLFSNA